MDASRMLNKLCSRVHHSLFNMSEIWAAQQTMWQGHFHHGTPYLSGTLTHLRCFTEMVDIYEHALNFKIYYVKFHHFLNIFIFLIHFFVYFINLGYLLGSIGIDMDTDTDTRQHLWKKEDKDMARIRKIINISI